MSYVINQNAPSRSGLLKKRRYSNEGSTGGDGDSSSGFDWNAFLQSLFSSVTSISTSIWGSNNKWEAEAYNTMYQQEKRTNTILWIIIGLVVALGVFLVVRKK